MNNCFTFTYERLRMEGVKVPKEWEGLTYNKKDFIINAKLYLENKMHYKFFESFMTEVKSPRYGDIILGAKMVGFVVNRFKFISILDKTGNIKVGNISKRHKIMRAL